MLGEGKKEKCKFQIKLTIKEADGKLVELNEKLYLEVTWWGNKGILNPGKFISWTDEYGNSGGRRLSQGMVVQIKKNGKSYDFIVKIYELKKGWFYDEINGVEAEGGIIPAPNSNFTIVYPINKEIGEFGKPHEEKARMLWEKDPKEKFMLIKPIQLRWQGPVLVGIIIFLVLVIIVSYYILKHRKEKKFTF